MIYVNYIKEINAFYQRQETNPLSSATANLCHTSMHVNNRTGLIREFTVASLALCSKANLTESTFKRARTELSDKGYIFYESQGGNRAAKYQIICHEWSTMGDSSDRSTDQAEVHNEQQSTERSNMPSIMDHKASPLLKQNETKQNKEQQQKKQSIFLNEISER